MRKFFSLTLIFVWLSSVAQEPVDIGSAYWRVQVGAFQKPDDLRFDNFKDVGREFENGIYKYTVGFFTNRESAVLYRDSIRVTGYPDAFIVAYINGKRASLKEIEAHGLDLAVVGPDTVKITVTDTVWVSDEEIEAVDKIVVADSVKSAGIDIELARQKLNRITWMKVALGQTALVGGVVLGIVTGAWVPVMMGVAVVEIYLLAESKYRFNRRDLKKITGW
jgi:hypothetical protein